MHSITKKNKIRLTKKDLSDYSKISNAMKFGVNMKMN